MYRYLGAWYIGEIVVIDKSRHLLVGRYCIYVVSSDASERCIYVGRTTEGTKRIKQHAMAKGVNLAAHYPLMDVLNMRVEFWEVERTEHVAAENYLITHLDPTVNRTHLRGAYFASLDR